MSTFDERTAPPIGPRMKVAEFLAAYPELEDVLIGLAPAFEKLRNPLLRRTAARLATLETAAGVGGLTPRELVVALREAAGQPVDGWMCGMGEQPVEAEGGTPPWCAAGEVREIIDADALIAAGEVPLVRAMRGARRLQRGERLEIAVSFEPVPLVEALREKGYRTFTRRSGKGRFTVIGATVDAG